MLHQLDVDCQYPASHVSTGVASGCSLIHSDACSLMSAMTLILFLCYLLSDFPTIGTYFEMALRRSTVRTPYYSVRCSISQFVVMMSSLPFCSAMSQSSTKGTRLLP